jgi:hypothetical protein
MGSGDIGGGNAPRTAVRDEHSPDEDPGVFDGKLRSNGDLQTGLAPAHELVMAPQLSFPVTALRVDLHRLRRAVLFRSRERTRSIFWHRPSQFLLGNGRT